MSTPNQPLNNAHMRQRRPTNGSIPTLTGLASSPRPTLPKATLVNIQQNKDSKVPVATPAVPVKFTSKQKKISTSDSLKVLKKQSSGKSTNVATPKQVVKMTGAVGLKSRKNNKALEKETVQIKKALKQQSSIKESSSGSSDGIGSPEFGVQSQHKKKAEPQIGKPKL